MREKKLPNQISLVRIKIIDKYSHQARILGSEHGTFMDFRIDFLYNSSKNIKEHSCVD